MTTHTPEHYGGCNEHRKVDEDDLVATYKADKPLAIDALAANRVAQRLLILFAEPGLPGISDDRPKRESLHGFDNRAD